jgi:hypothetical protein
MADPQDPTSIKQTGEIAHAATESVNAFDTALGGLGDTYGSVSTNVLNFNNIQQTTSDMFTTLSTKVGGYIDGLSQLSTVTDTSSARFGMLSAALVKTQEAFRGFGGIDKTRVVGFTEQYEKLFKTIQESPMSTMGKAAIAGVEEALGKTGATAAQTSKAIDLLKKGSVDFARSLLTGADNMLHYQNAMIQTAAAQGSMQDLLTAVHDDFSNLNQVTREHMEVMSKSMGVTGLSQEHMQEYMNVLKNLPGGMENFGKSVQAGGQDLSLLTAAIQYATGSGRDMAAVQTDMAEAMNSYGAGVEDALKYSARMSQVSETLGARVEDVQSAINGSAEAFKSFVWGGVSASDMTKGLAEGMEMYAKRLNDAGVPIKNAIEMSKNLQAQMSNLSVGQEAFISQQTGGPGGVRGALQYERLMKEHPEEAMKKMDENLKKMMGGKLVTEKQAEGSDAAANQFMKQTMLLQQWTGTQNRQQAEAMSDAMASGNLKQAAQKGTFDETVARGAKLEDLQKTKVSQMNVQSDSVQLMGGITNLGTLQDATTARSGNGAGGPTGTGRGVNIAGQNSLQEYSARLASGQTGSAIQELMNTAKEMPQAFKDIASSAGEALTSGDADKEKEELSELQERKAALMAAGKTDQASAAQKMIDTMQTAMGTQQPADQTTPTTPTIPGLGGAGAGQQGKAPVIPGLGGATHAPAGKQVGSAIPGLHGGTGTGQPGTGTGGAHTPGSGTSTIGGLGRGPGGPVPVSLAPGTVITIEHTGTCPHCGRQNTSTEQAKARSTASVASNS